MRTRELPQIELQIAPLIDVCFLLLFFYILTSTPEPKEGALTGALPGTAPFGEALDIPEEQILRILENGQVVLNEQPLDMPESTDLPQLQHVLVRFQQSAAAHHAEPLLSIAPENKVPHQRLLDVINVCRNAGISSVTFADSEDAAQ